MKRANIFYLALGVIAAVAVAMMGCVQDGFLASDSGSSSGGKGGSMARFTIAGDFLYTVNDHQLTVVSLDDAAKPAEVDRKNLWMGGVETIFPMDTLLFIGSRSAMYIYDISNPEFPEQLSMTSHFRSCDPVVAADTLAFVTLNSSLGQWCGASQNVLQVYDIRDLENPILIDEEQLTSPRGLAVDIGQKLVFVCDGGLKAYDITDPRNIKGLYTTTSNSEVGRIDAYDCIAWQDRLLVIGADGLYQLGYDREKFTLISKTDLRTAR